MLLQKNEINSCNQWHNNAKKGFCQSFQKKLQKNFLREDQARCKRPLSGLLFSIFVPNRATIG